MTATVGVYSSRSARTVPGLKKIFAPASIVDINHSEATPYRVEAFDRSAIRMDPNMAV